VLLGTPSHTFSPYRSLCIFPHLLRVRYRANLGIREEIRISVSPIIDASIRHSRDLWTGWARRRIAG